LPFSILIKQNVLFQDKRKYRRRFTPPAYSLYRLGERNHAYKCCMFSSKKFFLINSVVRKQGDSDRKGQVAYIKGKHPASVT